MLSFLGSNSPEGSGKSLIPTFEFTKEKLRLLFPLIGRKSERKKPRMEKADAGPFDHLMPDQYL